MSDDNASRHLPKTPYLLPLLAGLLPLLAIHIAYLLSAIAAHVDWCFPYLQGCTSISRVGRQPPEELAFKGLMIPGLTLTVLYWIVCRQWLLRLGCTAYRRLRVMTGLGVAGAVFLIVYVVSLGEYGDIYRLLRRGGVNLGAGLTYLAQLLLFGLLHHQTNTGQLALPARLRQLFTWQIWLVLVIGVASVLTKALLTREFYDQHLADPFEWNLILLLLLHFFLVRRAWLTAAPQ